MLQMRNARIRRQMKKQDVKEPKILQLGQKYLSDPEFVAKHRKPN